MGRGDGDIGVRGRLWVFRVFFFHFVLLFFPPLTVIPNPVHVVISLACVYARIPRPARSPTSTTTFATTVSTTRTSNSTASPSCTTSPSSWRTPSFHRSTASPKGAFVGQQLERRTESSERLPSVSGDQSPRCSANLNHLYNARGCGLGTTPRESSRWKKNPSHATVWSRVSAPRATRKEGAGGRLGWKLSHSECVHVNRFWSVAVVQEGLVCARGGWWSFWCLISACETTSPCI